MGDLYLQHEYAITSGQLVFAMLGMGFTLRAEAFMEVMRAPKGFALGLLSVLVLSPSLAVLTSMAFGLEAGIATGLVLVAAVPGGTMSNILVYFAKADVPLSIALTAVATTGCLVTTPIVLQVFAGSVIEGEVQMPGARIALEILFFLLIPLGSGMLLGKRFDARREELSRFFIRASLLMIGLIVVGSAAADRIDPGQQTGQVVAAVLFFSFGLFAIGFGLLRLGGLSAPAAVAAGIETSYRNISLGLLVKASVWPAREGIPDAFADQVFFVVLFYGAVALVTSLPPLFLHRRHAEKGTAG